MFSSLRARLSFVERPLPVGRRSSARFYSRLATSGSSRSRETRPKPGSSCRIYERIGDKKARLFADPPALDVLLFGHTLDRLTWIREQVVERRSRPARFRAGRVLLEAPLDGRGEQRTGIDELAVALAPEDRCASSAGCQPSGSRACSRRYRAVRAPRGQDQYDTSSEPRPPY